MKICHLCTLEKISHWYYKDDLIAIIDCQVCKIPMVVILRHMMDPVPEEMDRVHQKCQELFGDSYSFRKEQRNIRDHFHWHVIGISQEELDKIRKGRNII